ncbi:Nn.00g100830.m01.CDS01 [Neocucurbitaria sp. VM-36]
MLNFIPAIIGVLVTQASATCTRETLKAVTDELLAAQTAGQTSFSSLADTVAYSENRKKVDIKSGVLSKALKVDHVRSQHDVPQCAAFSEFIVTNSAAPYVIATQLRLDNTTNKVSQIDSIVTTKGDWLFNVTGTYYWASQEKWDPIPVDKRDSRAVIQAAGDAYCDIFNNKSVKVPWGQPCARLEGGSYTGKGQASDKCDVGIPSGVKLVNRQYVVDEEYGTVDIIMDFGGTPGGSGGLPDSHDFRVEGGKLRYVHTLSSCGGRSCM